MFSGLYYRVFHRADWKHERGLQLFADKCLTAAINRTNRRAQALRHANEEAEHKRRQIKRYLERVPKQLLLSDDEYFGMRRSIRTESLIVLGILLAETYLTYISMLILITGETAGIALLRWAIAIALSFGAIGAAEKLVGVALAKARYKSSNTPGARSVPLVVMWSVLLAVLEFSIAVIAEARARDIEGGPGGLRYYGFIALSMVLPLIAGATAWHTRQIYDAYRHTNKFRAAEIEHDKLDLTIHTNDQAEDGYKRVMLGRYWNTFSDFRAHKENFNRRKGIEEDVSGHWCNDFATFENQLGARYGRTGGSTVHEH